VSKWESVRLQTIFSNQQRSILGSGLLRLEHCNKFNTKVTLDDKLSLSLATLSLLLFTFLGLSIDSVYAFSNFWRSKKHFFIFLFFTICFCKFCRFPKSLFSSWQNYVLSTCKHEFLVHSSLALFVPPPQATLSIF